MTTELHGCAAPLCVPQPVSQAMPVHQKPGSGAAACEVVANPEPETVLCEIADLVPQPCSDLQNGPFTVFCTPNLLVVSRE